MPEAAVPATKPALVLWAPVVDPRSGVVKMKPSPTGEYVAKADYDALEAKQKAKDEKLTADAAS